MRIFCLVLLCCAFPFIALSQIPHDKAILEDYAHPAYIQKLDASASTIIIGKQDGLYLAASATPGKFHTAQNNFRVIKHISPQHAIIQFYQHGYQLYGTGRYDDGWFEYVLPAGNAWKFSPALIGAIKKRAANVQLVITVKDPALFRSTFVQQVTIVSEYRSANIFLVQPKHQQALDALLAWDQLLFADVANRLVKEELLVSGFDLGANKINKAHHHFPNVHGEGLMASIKENRFDTLDIDLRGRIVYSNLASATMSGHASIMATMLGGAGNSFYEGKGVAWSVGLQSVSFANLLPEPDSYYADQRISVQNHSYGTGIENFYGADAAAYDASVVNNPVLLHVFSAGNSGQSASSGPYTGITGLANLTGSFKMAKNNLVAGAIDSIGNVELLSSKGPAYDGRIKPELVAFGQDGSSGAAAIVSGIALLVQHAYQQQHNFLPASALVKAILINTADDVGAKGPDFSSGYGNADAYEAVRSVIQSRFFNNTIQQGNTQTFNLSVPAGLRSLKLTLAWTDAPAQANAVNALVNNLDMELVHVPTGQRWQPWILSRYPHKDSLLLPAVRGNDTVNNVEQITLDAPVAGDYVINVKGTRVNTSQTYFIAYSADTANSFGWVYPMRADPMHAGSFMMIRWESGFSAGTTGQLQYSLPNGAWQTISGNVDLGKNYFRWNTPDTFSTAVLRMTVNGSDHNTDTFVLSKLITTQVGFNCADSFLFYWNRPEGVNSFRIYKRGNKFMEPVTVTNDTFYIASKAAAGSRQFTVAPIVNGREGIRAYGFDYTSQGVDCYVKSFLSRLDGNKATLELELGSLYRVSRIVVQKLSGGAFKDLQMVSNPSALAFSFDDAVLHQGVNTYRIALRLDDGSMVYSNTEVVYYVGSIEYVIYPNPARVTGSFRILQKEPVSIRVLVYDISGRKVKEELHSDIINTISIAGLQRGVYVIVIDKEGARSFRQKLVID